MNRYFNLLAMALLHATLGITSPLAYAQGAAVAARLPVTPVQAAADNIAALKSFSVGDGSFTHLLNGDFIDPYFVNKAFSILLKHAPNKNAPEFAAASTWLNWLLPKQRADGSFDRYCKTEQAWKACQRADADDSTVATTLELLSLVGWGSAQHPKAALVASRAVDLLWKLKAPSGIFQAHLDSPNAYLMDNCEVYAGLQAASGSALFSDVQRKQLAAQAKGLSEKITAYFYSDTRKQWRPALPVLEVEMFYPHIIAPTYRWHTGLVTAKALSNDATAWLALHRSDWLTRKRDAFSWGAVALGLYEAGQLNAVKCWRESAAAAKAQGGWTLIDAAVEHVTQGVSTPCQR